MFDSVVDLLGSLSPAVASLNSEVMEALRAEAGGRQAAPGNGRPAVPAGAEADAGRDSVGVDVGAGAEGLDEVRQLLEGLDPASLDEAQAVALHRFFVEGERLMTAGRALTARALEGSGVWRREGFRSAAQWSAAQAGVPAGPAIRARETLGLLDDLPLAGAAWRAGRLSLHQAMEIADAASECPEAEASLVAAAQKLPLSDLAEECQRVKAAATDEAGRHRRIRKGRFCRTWTDRDGGFRLSARLTADEGARLAGAIDTRRDEILVAAKKGGWYENAEAHRADALVDLALTEPAGHAEAAGWSGPGATVHVFVDYDALVRGHAVAGERCEIPGVGPIPAEVARRMATDCILKVILTRGVDITAVAHAGRTIPAHLRTALECRDPQCIVPGCEVRRGLQIDHRDPWAATRDTSLANTARLCRWHHYQKSVLGYRYRGGPGTWEWIPPDEPPEPPSPEAITAPPAAPRNDWAYWHP